MRAMKIGACLGAIMFAVAHFPRRRRKWAAKQPATGQAAGETPRASKAAHGPGAPADRFTVPTGTAADLVAYIKTLINGPAVRVTNLETVKKMRKAILEAAERILTDKPTDLEREFAVQAKMNMLESRQQLADFTAELQRAGRKN